MTGAALRLRAGAVLPVRLWVPLAVLLAGCTQAGAGAADPPRAAPEPSPAAVEDVLARAAEATLAVDPNHVVSSTVLAGPQARHTQQVEGHAGQQPGRWSVVLVDDGARAEARVIDEQAWLTTQAEQTRSLLPPGKAWVRLDPDRLAAAGVPATWDQLALVEVLRGADAIQEQDVETVEAVPARRYTFQVDLERAACLARPDLRGTVAQLASGPAAAEATIAAEAWVDDFDLVRQLVITVRFDADRTATYELHLPGDNAAAPVQPPPADQVVPIEQLPELEAVIPAAPPAPPAPSC